MKKLLAIFFISFFKISLANEIDLNQLVDIGIKNNPLLKSKYYEYQKNIYLEKENFFNLFPKISLEYKYSKQQEKKIDKTFYLPVLNSTTTPPSPTNYIVPNRFSFTFIPSNFFSFNLMVKEIISPAVYEGYKLSSTAKNLSFYNYKQEKNKLIDKISKAYFDYQKVYYSYKVAQSYLNLTSILYKNAKYLFKKGLITKKDLLQAKYYYQKSIEGLVKAINYRHISKKYLSALVNSKIKKIKVLDPLKICKNILNVKLKDSSYYYKLAQNHNPIFKLLSQKENLAYKKYELERSKLLPNLVLFTGYTKTNQYKDLGTISYTSIGFAISWQLGINNFEAITKEKKEILQARYENSNIMNLISLDINQTLYKLNNNLYSIKSAMVKLDQAKELYKMSMLKYKEGLATSKEVYDAIKDLNDAKNELAQGTFNFLTNYYHLNYLTGFQLKNILK